MISSIEVVVPQSASEAPAPKHLSHTLCTYLLDAVLWSTHRSRVGINCSSSLYVHSWMVAHCSNMDRGDKTERKCYTWTNTRGVMAHGYCNSTCMIRLYVCINMYHCQNSSNWLSAQYYDVLTFFPFLDVNNSISKSSNGHFNSCET